jgi:hypothetical protein
VTEEEVGDGGNDALAVRAVHQQDGGRFHAHSFSRGTVAGKREVNGEANRVLSFRQQVISLRVEDHHAN